ALGVMRRFLTFGTVLLLMLLSGGCASYGSSQTDQLTYEVPFGAIVLRVSVQSSEFTDVHPECGADCVPFYFWYKYSAEVKDVTSGSWDRPNVQCAHLQHGQYVPAVTSDCYVVLVPAAPELQER